MFSINGERGAKGAHRRPQVYQLLLLSRVIDVKYGRFTFFYLYINCFMQLGKYPVVTESYDHEFLRSNSVTNVSQNYAVENYRKYQKKQGSTIIMAWSLIIMEWS